MSLKSQRILVWGGVVSIVFFVIGWVGLMQFLPPLAPSDSASEIADTFDDRRDGIRLGAILMMIGTMLWVPWAAVIAAQPLRAERDRPLLAWTQVGSAATAAAVVIMSQIFWVVAAFRAERDPELTLLMSDLGFITAIMPFMIFVVWNLALAMAIFRDTDEEGYPRWAGYMCVWLAVLYIPGGALAFAQDGPLAWNGAIAFFLPAVAFFLWIIVMTVLCMKAITRAESAATAESPAAAEPVAA